MPDCCDYDREFSSRVAQADLRRYRKHGLDDLSQTLVDALTETVDGRSVLEVGGGVGAIQVELLKAGASRVTSVEMSSEYEAAARILLHAEGLEDRVDRRVGDFAESGSSVGEADLVVLNRVVCCYPHLSRLLEAAVPKAKEQLALTFPRQRRLVKLQWALTNVWSWLRRRDFRAYLHPPDEIFARVGSSGFKVAFQDQTVVWQTAVFVKAT